MGSLPRPSSCFTGSPCSIPRAEVAARAEAGAWPSSICPDGDTTGLLPSLAHRGRRPATRERPRRRPRPSNHRRPKRRPRLRHRRPHRRKRCLSLPRSPNPPPEPSRFGTSAGRTTTRIRLLRGNRLRLGRHRPSRQRAPARAARAAAHRDRGTARTAERPAPAEEAAVAKARARDQALDPDTGLARPA